MTLRIATDKDKLWELTKECLIDRIKKALDTVVEES